MHAHAHAHTHTHTHTCASTYIHMNTCTCACTHPHQHSMHIHTCASTHTQTCACKHTQAHAHTRTHIVCVHVCMCMHMCVCVIHIEGIWRKQLMTDMCIFWRLNVMNKIENTQVPDGMHLMVLTCYMWALSSYIMVRCEHMYHSSHSFIGSLTLYYAGCGWFLNSAT